jgi:hypothetical protein
MIIAFHYILRECQDDASSKPQLFFYNTFGSIVPKIVQIKIKILIQNLQIGVEDIEANQ